MELTCIVTHLGYFQQSDWSRAKNLRDQISLDPGNRSLDPANLSLDPGNFGTASQCSDTDRC